MRTFRPWYEREPKRFQDECADMQAQGFILDGEILRSRRLVEFHGHSQVDSTYPLVVRYPDSFPSAPPHVYSAETAQLLPRHHRPGTREFCLFGPTHEGWSANSSGTKAIDDAEQLLKEFLPGTGSIASEEAPEPDEAPEPMTTSYGYTTLAAILVPPSLATPTYVPNDTVVTGTFRLRFPSQPKRVQNPLQGQGIIIETRLGGVTTKADAAFQDWCRGAKEEQGTLICLPGPPPYLDPNLDKGSRQRFNTWLQDLKIRHDTWMAFVFPEQSGSATTQRLSWLVANLCLHNNVFDLVRTFPMRAEEGAARIPGFGGLATKKVALIGCGSIGSKIAAGLAATGVNRFGLGFVSQ